jgi:hypothetical protein
MLVSRVVIESNERQGIGATSGSVGHFNSLLDLPAAIEAVLVDAGITLHRSLKMAVYLATEPVTEDA